MIGSVYVFDFGDFRKVGKSTNAEARRNTLEGDYKLTCVRSWVSEPFDRFDDGESIAHSILAKSLISGEKFYSSFEDSVKACMSACSRASSQIDCGVVDGIQVLADQTSGYINVTELKKSGKFTLSIGQFLKNDGVKYLSDEIESSGYVSFFTTRGRNSATFVHPYIFIEINRSMSAKSKLSVYNWMLYVMPHIKSIKKAIKNISEAK